MAKQVLFYSQPRQLPCAQQLKVNLLTSPYPAFFASTKPFLKWIAPTDNMQPKLHDKYTRNQWLKD